VKTGQHLLAGQFILFLQQLNFAVGPVDRDRLGPGMKNLDQPCACLQVFLNLCQYIIEAIIW
jgi:hypothetical protein